MCFGDLTARGIFKRGKFHILLCRFHLCFGEFGVVLFAIQPRQIHRSFDHVAVPEILPRGHHHVTGRKREVGCVDLLRKLLFSAAAFRGRLRGGRGGARAGGRGGGRRGGGRGGAGGGRAAGRGGRGGTAAGK